MLFVKNCSEKESLIMTYNRGPESRGGVPVWAKKLLAWLALATTLTGCKAEAAPKPLPTHTVAAPQTIDSSPADTIEPSEEAAELSQEDSERVREVLLGFSAEEVIAQLNQGQLDSELIEAMRKASNEETNILVRNQDSTLHPTLDLSRILGDEDKVEWAFPVSWEEYVRVMTDSFAAQGFLAPFGEGRGEENEKKWGWYDLALTKRQPNIHPDIKSALGIINPNSPGYDRAKQLLGRDQFPPVVFMAAPDRVEILDAATMKWRTVSGEELTADEITQDSASASIAHKWNNETTPDEVSQKDTANFNGHNAVLIAMPDTEFLKAAGVLSKDSQREFVVIKAGLQIPLTLYYLTPDESDSRIIAMVDQNGRATGYNYGIDFFDEQGKLLRKP